MVTHELEQDGSGKFIEAVSGGWPKILSNLKSLLETGEVAYERKKGRASMIDIAAFKPKTVYVTYIAAAPGKVWQALTKPEFTKQYFFGFAVDIEPKAGRALNRLLWPDGRLHVSGEVVEWSPPRRLSVTWLVEGMKDFGELPQCLVSYDIAPSGDAVRLTMTNPIHGMCRATFSRAARWAGTKILSGLKSLLETGKPLVTGNEGPPPEFIAAVKKAVADKPWLKRYRKLALIFSSAAVPGQRSFASSRGGVSTVLRWACRSSASGST